MAFAEAYARVADEHEVNVQLIRHSIATAKNRAGTEALMVYELVKPGQTSGDRRARTAKPSTQPPVTPEADKK